MHALQEQIETRRLVLVPMSTDAARAILSGDLSVVAHAEGWPHADTLDAVCMAVDEDAAWPVWLVTLDGRVIGDCGTVGHVDEAGDIDIGYGLAAEHRRAGYGTELIEGLSQWLLRQPGVRRVVAREVLADNTPSRRALERAGFRLERSDGGLVWYSLAGRSSD
ncbi:MAG TPA: GNAT family N-acetyltransferase [Gaiellaceae bacterium]